MSKDEILNAIIKGYRNVIDERYNYQYLKEKYTLPDSIGETIVYEVKYFFLNYIYPDVNKREELNAAFETLDDNIKNPSKLISVMKESLQLIFKHGRHLPSILKAGLKALKSYRGATKFENALVAAAKESGMKPPYNTSKINGLIKTLERDDIERFIKSTESLFHILLDKGLVSKIKEVIGYLVERMKRKQHVFSIQEINGLEVGLEMISKGEEVLNSLPKDDQELLIQMIIKVERDNLDELFT